MEFQGARVSIMSCLTASGTSSPPYSGDPEPRSRLRPRASGSSEPSLGLLRRRRWRFGRPVAAGCQSCSTKH